MAEGPQPGSERQGAGHAEREDGPGRCGRKPVCRLEPEKRGDAPKGQARGHAMHRGHYSQTISPWICAQ
ncbi:hypothetical protein SAMN05444339_1452 [Loktanella atrilutea]|uniref:Uncharacterized protein n=1 Tax=Loktanella atrilutea TaxID=366533 RepID=A0A1M5G9W0_LOKAT|nr:hypothetical protein SAMN05444339_1452 [Loktanella atrilutea]